MALLSITFASSSYFRAFTGAVTLKPLNGGWIKATDIKFPRLHRRGHIEASTGRSTGTPGATDFRAFTGAVTLKHRADHRRMLRAVDFRAFTGAVTLKPASGHVYPIGVLAFPRLHRRGHIEAGSAARP